MSVWALAACVATEPPKASSASTSGEPTTEIEPARGRLRILSGARLAAGDGLAATLFELEGAGAGDELGRGLDVLGDVDGDGRLDLVFQAGARARVLSGAALPAGTADPEALPTFGVADGWPVAVGDVTGDGVPDLAVVSDIGRQLDVVRVWSGAALAPGDPDVARFPAGGAWLARIPARSGDVDGDGVDDLLVARSDDAGAWVTGLFLGPLVGDVDADTPAVTFEDDGATGLGDVDGDGHADVGLLWPDAVGGPPDTVLDVFEGEQILGLGSVSHADARWTIVGETSVTDLVPAGDLDGDGADEVWVNHRTAEPHLDVFSGRALSGRTFGAADRTLTLSVPQPPAVGDFDGDGAPDLVVPWADTTGPVLLGFSGVRLDGTSSGPADAAWSFALDVGATVVAVGDVDGDGADDLALAQPRALTP